MSSFGGVRGGRGQTWFGRSFPLLSLGAMSGATLVLLLLPIDCVKGVMIRSPAKKSDASCTCVVSREDQCGQKQLMSGLKGKRKGVNSLNGESQFLTRFCIGVKVLVFAS